MFPHLQTLFLSKILLMIASDDGGKTDSRSNTLTTCFWTDYVIKTGDEKPLIGNFFQLYRHINLSLVDLSQSQQITII